MVFIPPEQDGLYHNVTPRRSGSLTLFLVFKFISLSENVQYFLLGAMLDLIPDFSSRVLLAVGGILGALCSFLFGPIDDAIEWLFVFIVADYLSGTYAAMKTGQWNSRTGFLGITKKIVMLSLVALCHGLDITSVIPFVSVRDAAVFAFCLNDFGSILENIERMGYGSIIPAPVRKMLGIRTIFNILGPLTNPAAATMQVMGVYEEALVRPMAEVLSNLGVKRGMVVYGQDCLDEISLSAPTSVCEIKDGTFEEYVITPEEFGMTRCTKEELVGGTPQENAEITKEILAGKKGPARDAVVLNAAAALHVAKEIPMQDAVKLAEELIDSGKAQKKLEEFVSLTNKLAEKE